MRVFTAMQVFNRVAELHGFAVAARDLGMSTSSVSRHVSDLEDELGVRLFNRTTRRLSLTDDGVEYQRRSSAILNDLDDLHNTTMDQHRRPSGRLRVTASLTLGEAWVVKLLPGFYEQYPDVFVELDMTDRIVDLIDDGFDVGIRSGELRDSTMIARSLMGLRHIVCASPDYIAQHGKATHPSQLKNHRCIQYIQPNRQGDDWWFDFDGKETWINVYGVMAVNNAWAARDLACAGVGMCYVPDFVVKGDLADGRLIHMMPDFDSAADPVHAVYPTKRHLSARVRVFVDYLVSHLDVEPDIG
jgi:DNA-binding transcriptional LysR family regulator